MRMCITAYMYAYLCAHMHPMQMHTHTCLHTFSQPHLPTPPPHPTPPHPIPPHPTPPPGTGKTTTILGILNAHHIREYNQVRPCVHACVVYPTLPHTRSHPLPDLPRYPSVPHPPHPTHPPTHPLTQYYKRAVDAFLGEAGQRCRTAPTRAPWLQLIAKVPFF